MRTTNSNDQGITHKVFGPLVLFFLGGVLHLALHTFETAAGGFGTVEELSRGVFWLFSVWYIPAATPALLTLVARRPFRPGSLLSSMS